MRSFQKIMIAGGALLLAASLSLNVYQGRWIVPSGGKTVETQNPVQEETPQEKAELLFERIYFSGGKYLYVKFHTDSSLVQPEEKTFFEITPEVKNLSCSFDGGKIIFYGDFKPETLYSVRILKGLQDEAERTLLRDLAVTQRCPKVQYSTELQFLANALYLPRSRKKLEFLYRTRGISECRIQLFRAFENNLNPYGVRHESRMVPVAEEKLKFSEPEEMAVVRSVDVGKYLKDRKSGVYLLKLSGNQYYEEECSFVLTDLAVQAAVNPKNRSVTVFVRKFSDLSAVPGAQITVLSRKNQTVASGTADSEGRAVLKYLPSFSEELDSIRAVMVHAGEEMSYFVLDHENCYSTPGPLENPDSPLAFVFTDRGICRPGDSFDVSMFIRKSGGKESSQTLKNAPFTCRVLDPGGKVFLAKALKTDEAGYADLKVELPASARVGTYTVETGLFPGVCWGRSFIRCAMYVPDRIKVRMNLPEKISVSQSVRAEAEASYYFGNALPQGSCVFTASARPGKNPSFWEKTWTVGAPSLFQMPDTVRIKGKVENGRSSFLYEGFEKKGGKAFSPVDLLVSCAVSEPGGRAVSATVSKRLFPTELFIGLRKKDSSLSAKNASLLFRLFPAENREKMLLKEKLRIAFDLRKVDWHCSLVKSGSVYRYEWREVIAKTPFSPADKVLPAGEIVFSGVHEIPLPKDLPAGCYEVTASSGRMKTILRFWHDESLCQDLSDSAAALSLKADAEEYFAGQEAGLLFDAPAEGEVFFVSDHFAKSFKVKKGKARVAFPIPASLETSRYHVGATFVYSMPGKGIFRRFGVASVRVNQKLRHALSVSLTAPAEALPRQKIPILVSLRDPAGRPCSGTVRLMLVDEGVLSLTAHETPDPYRAFYGAFSSSLAFYDVFGMVYPEMRILPDGSVGGDGAFASLRGKITEKPAARVILKAVKVPASGMAKVECDLPDFTGALRLMASAVASDRAGSAEKEIRVREDLEIVPSVPRFAAPGDEMEIVFSLFHRFKEKKKYTFTLELPESVTPAGGNASREGVFTPGKTALLRYRISLKEPGEQKIAWKLVSGGKTRTGNALLLVRRSGLPRSLSLTETLAPGEKKEYSFKRFFEEGAEGKIELSSSTACGVVPALEWLSDYPYDCLEQLSARAFPAVIAPELVKAGFIGENSFERFRHAAELASLSFLSMRVQTGGFSMWPGGRNEWTDGTLFAAHFLLEAAAKKWIEPDPSMIGSLKMRLHEIASDMAPAARCRCAYACFILSGEKDETILNGARNILASEKADFATLLAGTALLRGGYASEGLPHVRRALREQVWKQDVPHVLFLRNYASRLGMTLYLVSGMDPDAEKTLALLAAELNKLFRNDGSCWGSTQTNAWGVLGLGKWASMQKSAELSAVIVKNGKKTVVSGKDFASSLPEKTLLSVTNTGKGLLFVHTTMRGVPLPGADFPQEKIRIEKIFQDLHGRKKEKILHGDEVFVKLVFTTPSAVENAVVADLLPGGLEAEDERLLTRAQIPPAAGKGGKMEVLRMEKGDDRVLVFGRIPAGKSEFVYRARAVTRGTFAVPQTSVEAMYDADLTGHSENLPPMEIQ